jgi:glycosyltransferase involved in cell wall biosynthesis
MAKGYKRKLKRNDKKKVGNVVKNQKKIKVLAYCDSPTAATGFGTVSRNIFEALHRTGRYDIDILGINFWGDPHNFPYRIWPTGTNQQKDPYGRQKVVNMIPQMDFDVLFFLQDTFILDFLPTLIPHLKSKRAKPFKSIVYYPIDSILKPQWGKNVDVIDTLVAYCEFGKQETLKALPDREGIEVINHGVNTNNYFPLPDNEVKAFRAQYFGSQADKFIITNLNRNQQRKDVPRTLMAFKKFREIVPDSILYLHMAMKDQGWDLPEVCKNMGLDISKDVIFPQNFGPNQGYPINIVNTLYNASDVVVSTTTGEGFGLSWIESMATKTPIIMPNNTAMTEFITEDRGYLVKNGSNDSLFTILPHDNEILRPLVDVDDLVDKLVHIYNNREEAAQKAENAYKWVVEEMDWQKGIAKQWVELFDGSYEKIGKDQEKSQQEIESSIDKIIKTEEI